MLYFGIKRAKEEIEWLNVEIRRLLTSMLDEHYDFLKAIQTLKEKGDTGLASLLEKRWRYSLLTNTSISKHLQQIAKLPRFSGQLTPGVALHQEAIVQKPNLLPDWYHKVVKSADISGPPRPQMENSIESEAEEDNGDIQDEDQLVDLFQTFVATDNV